MDYTVFGNPIDQAAVDQLENCLRDPHAVKGALMADHHKGYSMPIGGVIAYEDAVSPSGVGFDIGCGNKAVRTNLSITNFGFDPDVEGRVGVGEASGRYYTFAPFMSLIQKTISFGMGRANATPIDHPLFENPFWRELVAYSPGLKQKAQAQLGTVGAGNHYVDLLYDEKDGQIWVANHFGSRGLGHTIATGVMNLANNDPWDGRLQESETPTVLPTDKPLGQFYIEAMNLAGEYAYAGRDYVAAEVVKILGAESELEVHNHHNFAWEENGLWVVRKGATPLTQDLAYIGGSMGEGAVIVRGRWINDGDHDNGPVTDLGNLDSAPHGAGRVMSRTQAAGKFRKMWFCNNQNCDFEPFRVTSGSTTTQYEKNRCPKCQLPLRKSVRVRDRSTAAIDWPAVRDSLKQRGIVVIGADADEAPGVYKNLPDVMASHSNIEIVNTLRPLGVIMAGSDTIDPYKD